MMDATETHILNLKMATAVMGWKDRYSEDFNGNLWIGWKDESGKFHPGSEWKPTTQLNQAMECVEAMRKRNVEITIKSERRDNVKSYSIICSNYNAKDITSVVMCDFSTLPLTICRVIARALDAGNQQKDGAK